MIEKTNLVNFVQYGYGQVQKNENPVENENTNIESLPKNSLEEAIGRSQVNFRGGKSELIKLTVQDKNLIEVIGKVFKLNEEEIKSVEDYTKEFLQEFKLKSMTSMKSDDIFEYANETACWSENISHKLNLSDYESLDLDNIITMHIDTGDITKFRNYRGETILEALKYSTDYTPVRAVLERNGVDEAEIEDIIHALCLYSKNRKLDSVFELFKKENAEIGDGAVKLLLKDTGIDSNQIADILIDFHSLAGKGRKERLHGINIHSIEEQCNDGLNTVVIAGEIDKKFNTGITKELLEMLEQRKTNTAVHQDGKSLEEVAYRIADKYGLPAGAEKDIIDIINAHSVPDSKEKIEKLIETLKKDGGANIEFP